ncbi:hypothetical protein CsSME_00036673 [Camellia sinensis var. sinensis]
MPCTHIHPIVIVAMDPGPVDPTVIFTHDDVDSVILTCRPHDATIARMGRPDARIRWQSEAHTFHLTSGEATITLQDVSILSGLWVDGNVVTGNTGYDWPTICNRLLGIVPLTNQLKGSRLNMMWLSQTYGNLPIGADNVTVQHYAGAFTLQLLGGSIFAGKYGNMMHLMFERFHLCPSSILLFLGQTNLCIVNMSYLYCSIFLLILIS